MGNWDRLEDRMGDLRMKKKVLLAGMQDTIIDDFFMHTSDSFACMTSSNRLDDLQLHIEVFEPEVFVYCLGKDEKGDMENIRMAKKFLRDSECIIVTIGDKAVFDNLSVFLETVADASLVKPISIMKIQKRIENVLEDRRIEQEVRLREEQKKNEELLKAQQESEKNAKKHILVIDDDPVMLRTIKHYLEEQYVVATAPSGKFALKFLGVKQTDLVLLDYEMPEMSGPEVFEAIKGSAKTEDIPVVFLTGISDTAKIKGVLAMQPQGYLLKPVDYERLHQTIEGILGAQEG